jgi:hypothetical protein
MQKAETWFQLPKNLRLPLSLHGIQNLRDGKIKKNPKTKFALERKTSRIFVHGISEASGTT